MLSTKIGFEIVDDIMDAEVQVYPDLYIRGNLVTDNDAILTRFIELCRSFCLKSVMRFFEEEDGSKTVKMYVRLVESGRNIFYTATFFKSTKPIVKDGQTYGGYIHIEEVTHPYILRNLASIAVLEKDITRRERILELANKL